MTVWIGTSWKMNKTIAEARDYASRLAGARLPSGVQTFVMPPHTALAAVRDLLPRDGPVLVGAQNAHWADEGAWTGEVSMRMVRDAGAELVEIGHSERREHFGETDETVARKVRAAVDHRLVPLVCVGEPWPVRAAGGAEDFVVAQVRAAGRLLAPDEVATMLIAYEPVWAIGSAGRPAEPTEVSTVFNAIAEALADTGCRGLLYGGGVDPANAADLLRDKHVDGLFVGRRGWAVDGLLELVTIAASTLDDAHD